MSDHDLHKIAFPRLSERQLTALSRCPLSKFKRFHDRERLFSAGDCECDLFVVKSGQIEVLDESEDPPRVVHVHGPGEFTGEVAQLTCSPALITAVAKGDVEAYAVSDAALKQLINHHPEVGDVILQAFLTRRQLLTESGKFTGIRVIGPQSCKDTFRLREFLAKNYVPFTWMEPATDPRAAELLRRLELTEADLPAVVWGRRLTLRNPSERQLAEALGLRKPLEKTIYDLVVVGAGPAGLAAAVYAASEGLNTVVLERIAPGGQAGRSMRIENYLGFPVGITGGELAERAAVQAQKFGAQIPVASYVTGLSFDNAYPVVSLDDGQSAKAKCLLIATGANYRLIDVPGCLEFEGRGVYYAATPVEAQMCRGGEAVVVGGGNSAAQAATYLASLLPKVYMVVRGDTIHKGMSAYLTERIEDTPNIEVLLNTEVARISGDDTMKEVELVNRKTGERRVIQTSTLFSFIGAVPRSDWLPPDIERDEKQFVRTGPELATSPNWKIERAPYLLETSRPGVFAAGDVRSGAVNRVASAVGEGAMTITFVHRYLNQLRS
jgi:thioredoxin reductase (NADPH)